MNSETKTCQNCHNNFVIEPEDFRFYEKINIPPPTFCPECRNMRRMAWREYHLLYRGTCALCGKAVVTVHAPGGPFTIYCRDCYKSDKWDPMSYGQEYDFNKPFFAQYQTLLEAVPRPALTGNNLVNSEYSHGCEGVKNCYYVFWSYNSEYSENCYGLLLSQNCFDCYLTDNSDHAYESLHSNRLYRVGFGYFADECLDSTFLYNCVSCSDCFGCINLRKQKYCLFNEQLSKVDYFARLKEWDMGSYKKLEEAKRKFRALYFSVPHRSSHVISCQNVTGDIIRNAKNCQNCFIALDGVENCKNIYGGGLNLRDSQDVSAGGVTTELNYETYGVTGNTQRCFFSAGGGNCQDTWYCDWAHNSSDVFGCVSVRNKRYSILNKQYSRGEYVELTAQIRRHMDEMPYIDKKGRVYKFGEFFPTELSAYAYNETFGFPFYPKTKEAVLSEGWRWQDPQPRTYQITLRAADMPEHIRDTNDSILEQTIGCLCGGKCDEQCITAFRISPNELEFHRTMNLALPRVCSNCRDAQRLVWRNNFRLWHRRCACDKVKHFHAGQCPEEFETTFPPDRPEIIYCDKCYKTEFF
ncbi:MAG: hypothetical protein V1856_00830 [Candidatus Liptonbacteria bacterium]